MIKSKATLESIHLFFFFSFYIPFSFLKASISQLKASFFFFFCMESDNFQLNVIWNSQGII